MKTLKYNLPAKLILPVLWVLLIVSCNEKETLEDFSPARMFTPIGQAITVGETQVKIEWSPSLFSEGKDVQYTVQISKDSLFQSAPEYSVVSDTNFVVVTDANIAIRQKYFARVKANTVNGTPESNWMVSNSFTMLGEQIFKVPVAEADIIDRAVILRWTTTPGVTKLVLTPQGGSPFDVAITAAENTAGNKLVENLSGNTNYTAEIFAGTKSKGIVSFKTKATITGTSVIDLRGITGRPSVLADTIPVIPSGSIVILKRGLTYTISATTNLNKSITILSGADFIPDLASIFFSSNFNITAGSAIDSIVFQDLNMLSNSYADRYVFNINQVGTISKVRFENVRGHRFRGFFRMQTGSTGTKVTNFIVQNCVIDSLRDFSLVNTNNSNTVENIRVTNTTLYHARKVIDHRSPGSQSIVFENCTFNNLPGGGAAGGVGASYFIDLGTANSASPISIKNCIFGKTWDDQGTGNDALGIRAGTSTTVSTVNSYSTSDFIITTAAAQIPGLVSYPNTAASLFEDPDNGNFKIKDASFAGKNSAGDPRWR